LNINDHFLVGRTGFSVNRFDYGISEEIGHRATMEDACSVVQNMNIVQIGSKVKCLFPQSYFAVYDGHGGSEASSFLAKTLHVRISEALLGLSSKMEDKFGEDNIVENMKEFQRRSGSAYTDLESMIKSTLAQTFSRTDDEFIEAAGELGKHGSTATTALLLGNWLFCSNTGDSRTMICRNFKAVPMTQDHKPAREDEFNRIKAAGGFVISNRVMGELAVSRAFGDVEFKKGFSSLIEDEDANESNADDFVGPLIIAEPEVQVTIIDENDQFLLLACDGLFDVFTEDEVVVFVKREMEKHGDTQLCCQNITYEAINKRNSRDNVSVILVILNRWY
jgi:serine/threonine protein phosphatase PrpC